MSTPVTAPTAPGNTAPANTAPVDIKSDGWLCGCGKIVGGVIAVPVVVPISLLIGVGMTAVACLQCRCAEEEFLKQRSNFCACWGIGTGCLVGASLIAMGVDDIRYLKYSKQEVVVAQDMRR